MNKIYELTVWMADERVSVTAFVVAESRLEALTKTFEQTPAIANFWKVEIKERPDAIMVGVEIV